MKPPVALDVDPVFHALSTPELYLGVERTLFRKISVLCTFTFVLFHTFVWSIALFVVLLFVGRHLTKIDPQLIQMLAKSRRVPARFDPAKYVHRDVVILDVEENAAIHAAAVPTHA